MFVDSNQNLCSVIVIDDEELDRNALKYLFQKKGVQSPVLEAESGDAAFKLLKKLNENKELDKTFIIFLDISMPNMDGFECLELIKKDPQFSHITVFMLSTSGQRFDVARSEKSGAMAFFNKMDVSEDEDQFINDVITCCSVL